MGEGEEVELGRDEGVRKWEEGREGEVEGDE